MKAAEAAKYYQMAADQGDVIGSHWIGVFYHDGFGVTKNLDKAIENLTVGVNAGNGQSMYQMYLIHSGTPGQDEKYKDPVKAYRFLLDAIYTGVTYFDEIKAYFSLHVDALKDTFSKNNPHLTLDLNNNDDIKARHNAFVDELKVNFSSALGKDRMYHRPCGFLND